MPAAVTAAPAPGPCQERAECQPAGPQEHRLVAGRFGGWDEAEGNERRATWLSLGQTHTSYIYSHWPSEVNHKKLP
eukprot:3491496-Rhodomonas_salina.1